MNWDIIEGNWKQLKGNVKQQWGKLTDDTLDQIGGKRDQLAGKIQETYGVSNLKPLKNCAAHRWARGVQWRPLARSTAWDLISRDRQFFA
jgi:uncharacterized protein YjbJ (UPF0337 family)